MSDGGHTADDVKALLSNRFSPPEYLYMEEFEVDAHPDDKTAVKRYIDAYTFCLVPTWGLLQEGYEIKVARADWLTELKTPLKAEACARRVDKFWVVAPKGVVQEAELPSKWGLMVVQKNGLRIVKQAEVLREVPEVMSMRSVAFMLRKGLRQMQDHALSKAYKEGHKRAEKRVTDAEKESKRLGDLVHAANEAVGLDIINVWAQSKEPIDTVTATRIKAALALSDESLLNHAARLERAVESFTHGLPDFVAKVGECVQDLTTTARLHPAGVLMNLGVIPIASAWRHIDQGAKQLLLIKSLPRDTAPEDIDRLVNAYSFGSLPMAAQVFLKRLSPEDVRGILKEVINE